MSRKLGQIIAVRENTWMIRDFRGANKRVEAASDPKTRNASVKC